MGREQRLREESEEPRGARWKPAREAPKEAWPVAICGTILCSCGKGGRIVFTGSRHHGHWVHDCEHEVEITHYYVMPMPPLH